MDQIKAVIFDMDGVLIDAREWHYEALNRALGLFGYSVTRYDHLVTFDGLPTRKKLEMLTRERGLPRALHAFVNDLKQRYTTELVHTSCKPIFHHEYALSSLRARGYKMAVASNSIRATIDLMMEKSNLAKYLEFTLSNQDVVEGKPDPEIYLACIARLGLQPTECLIVEDNEHGVLAATRSGAHVLRVANPTDVNLDNILARIESLETGAYEHLSFAGRR